MLRPLHFEVGRFPFFLGGGGGRTALLHTSAVCLCFCPFVLKRRVRCGVWSAKLLLLLLRLHPGADGWMDGWVDGRTDAVCVGGRETMPRDYRATGFVLVATSQRKGEKGERVAIAVAWGLSLLGVLVYMCVIFFSNCSGRLTSSRRIAGVDFER